MNSVKISIAMAAILFAAAFAGVMLIDDDADAAETTYKVTYVYGDNIKVETVAADADGVASVTLKTFDVVFGGIECPTGYEPSQWKVGSNLYGLTGDLSITSDITVEPVFKANKAIVKLVYGDKAMEFVGTADVADPAATGVKEITAEDLTRFGTTIGATFTVTGSTISATMDGYVFCGFVKASNPGTPSKVLDLTRTGNGVETYTAVFEQVYDVTFIVENAVVMTTTSDKITIQDKFVAAGSDFCAAPAKANHLFMGWCDETGDLVFSYSADLDKYSVSDADYKITSDMQLSAKFVPVTFTVTFVYGEDRAVFTTETVKYGDLAIEPKGLPEGYKGWDWNFGVPIEADTEIPAIEADPVTVYTVTFEIDGKAPVTQRSDSMVLPDTAIDGKVFQGWVVKGQSQYVNPMSYEIVGDITFVAVYKEADPPAGPGFFETTTGQCVAVIIAVVIIALIYAVATNMFGLKDALTSVKITRVKK